MEGHEAIDHDALALQDCFISVETGPVATPNSPARATILATPALQISFARETVDVGAGPANQRRSMTATFWPACASSGETFVALTAADDNCIIFLRARHHNAR